MWDESLWRFFIVILIFGGALAGAGAIGLIWWLTWLI